MRQFLLLISFAMCCIVIPSTNGQGAEQEQEQEQELEQEQEQKQEPCAGYKIRVGCKECNKGSHKAQGPYHTYYYAQNDQKGGNTWYKTGDGKYAIWYDSNRGSWNIGNAIDVDTDSRGAHGISNANCPY